MSKNSKALVAEALKKMKMKPDKNAADRLANILDELTEHILHGAEKIARFTGKKKIDRDAVNIAAHVNIRSKELKILRKL